MRSNLFFFFLTLILFLSHSLIFFSFCLNPFDTFPSGKGFKLGLQPVLKSFFHIYFLRERGYILSVNAFKAWQSDAQT